MSELGRPKAAISLVDGILDSRAVECGSLMSRLTMLASLAMLALPAGACAADNPPPAPLTDEVNKAMPPWLKLSGEERVRYENVNDAGFSPVNDGYLLTRFRLTLEIKPANWIRFTLQAQDSRVFGQNALPAPATQKDAIDLRIGYVDLGTEAGPAALRIGRQPFTFGESRLLGDPDWSNVGRTFDAARLTLRSTWGKVDLFSGAYVKIDQVSFSEPVPSQHLHGFYGTFTQIVPKASIEPYAFWRLEHSFKNEAGRSGNLDERTVGVRFAGKLPSSFDYSLEAARQNGSYAGDPIHAWAAHSALGYALPAKLRNLRAYGEWNQASGDRASKDGRHQGFDQLYPAGHDKLGFDDLFSWTNIRHFRGGIEYKVHPRLMLMTAMNGYWLDSATDGIYSGSGKVIARSAAGTAGTHVGSEFDVQGKWTVRPGTVAHLGYGRLVPGEFLQHTTAGLVYNLFTVALTQRF